MVLDARRDPPERLRNVFIRRALWESAVIGYGRSAVDVQKQKLAEEEPLRAADGDAAVSADVGRFVNRQRRALKGNLE
jgi:hypothetical protein